jgi:hypothetical protein
LASNEINPKQLTPHEILIVPIIFQTGLMGSGIGAE